MMCVSLNTFQFLHHSPHHHPQLKDLSCCFFLIFFFFKTEIKKSSTSLSMFSLLITCDHSACFQKHLFTAPQLDKDNNRDDALIAGMEGEREEEECVRVCGMSSQIVFTFHLVGSLSIPVFICISAGVCAGSWRVFSVYVCVQQLPK